MYTYIYIYIETMMHPSLDFSMVLYRFFKGKNLPRQHVTRLRSLSLSPLYVSLSLFLFLSLHICVYIQRERGREREMERSLYLIHKRER